MTNAPGTTILMRYSQFMRDVIPSDLAADFDLTGERTRSVHRAFLEALGITQGQRREQWDLTQEDYSRAWVRALLAFHVRR